MSDVGVVGLGNIGGAIASNLVADGHAVTVFDVDAERMKSLTGATAAPDVAALATACEITMTSLPNPETIDAVAKEWAGAATPGSILLDLSTTAPESNREIAARLAGTGHHFVEAPLTGGAIGAQQRRLVFMIGGDDEPVARCQPLLDSLGRATFHLGPVGTGTTMKLVNSLLAFTSTIASLEGLSVAAAAGIDVRTAVEVVRTGGASNFFIDRAVEGIDQRGRPAQFTLGLAAKDAGLLEELTAASGVPPTIALAVAEFLTDAVQRGLGERDWSDLVVAAEQRSGVPLHFDPETA